MIHKNIWDVSDGNLCKGYQNYLNNVKDQKNVIE